MFTGIIEKFGKIDKLIRFKDRVSLTVSCDFASELKIGDSVSVNGACLTVAENLKNAFRADVVLETIQKSTLNNMKVGDTVNLERALAASGRFDGHIVQGHVDAKALIINIQNSGSNREIEISIPEGFGKYIAGKGSVAVDGISLTVAWLGQRSFKIAIVPHTYLKTTLFKKHIGDWVNLEFDVLTKYVERLLKEKPIDEIPSLSMKPINEEFLKQAGFLN